MSAAGEDDTAAVRVKEEREWEGASEAAATLYADHEVKRELVLGPEQLQPQDIASATQKSLCTTEAVTVKQEPAAGQSSQPGVAPGRGTITRHRVLHTENKPYSCDICKKEFTKKNTLATHRLIHTGEKPYSCEVCKKQFRQKSTLTTHRLIHTGENPYTCDICKKQFKFWFGHHHHR